MTQGKIERYHRTMKNIVKLQNYWYPEELEREIARFVRYYNDQRVHESLKNVTPAQMYRGEQHKIITKRMRTKRQTLEKRKEQNLQLRKKYRYNTETKVTP